MARRPLDLAGARVLLCNDDGMRAPGLLLLERIVRDLAAEVWVVAPEREQSATGHALTIHSPLRLYEHGPRRIGVDGTPTDAVLLALRHIMVDSPPDLVISGINRGGNIGGDVTYSGTVGAAIEAALCGVPAIALSQNTTPGAEAKWQTAEAFAAEVLRTIVGLDWPADVVINVNFPDVMPADVRGVQAARLGFRKPGGEIVSGRDPADKPYLWISTRREVRAVEPGTDVHAAEEGWIAVTPLALDLTCAATLASLREALG